MSVQNDASEATGESQDNAVEVVRHVAQSIGQVWGRIAQPEGVEALLGPGARLGDKGDSWRATDGTRGVTRSYHPEQQIRVSWHADDDAPATLVDLQMTPNGEGTTLVLRHENLTGDLDRDALARRWEAALDRFVHA